MFEGKDVTVILANGGAGKCLPDSALIPTPCGFVRNGELKAGDYVYSADGKATKVLGVYPQGKKEAYKVTFSDGRYTVCNDEHLWGIYTRHGKHLNEWQYSVMSLKEMLEKGIRKNAKSRTIGNARFYIPSSPVVEGAEKELPCNPYVLGSFIGNGSCREKYLTLSSNDEWQVNKCASLLDCTVKRNVNNYSWYFYKEGKRVKTRDVIPSELCCYAHEKSIPSVYMFASVEQRKALLQGLFDTDGSVNTSSGRLHVSYSTSSVKLCSDVTNLLLTFGIVSSVHEDTRREHINYELKVNCSKEKALLLFTLPRKLERVMKFERKVHRDYSKVAVRSVEKLNEKLDMTCIYVEDEKHLYLCSDFVVTHNTTYIVNDIIKELEVRRPEEVAFVTFTRNGAQEGLRRVSSKLMLDADDLPYFRTLHSLTYHAMNYEKCKIFGKMEQRKFNKEYGYALNRCEVGTGKVSPTKDTMYLDYYDLMRSDAITSRQIANTDIELGYYNQLVSAYNEFKEKEGTIDFFDCLINYAEKGEPLPCKVVYIDECFSPNTKVRMADMSTKEIKDIKVGEFVIGTKGATKVTAIHKGVDTMYDVVSGMKQKLFTCNSKHLVLQKSAHSTVYTWKHCEDIKRRAYVFTAECKANRNNVPEIEPYFFGLWLGNGFSREAVVVCNEKDIETINWLTDYGKRLGDKVTLRHRTGITQIEYSVKVKGKALKCEVRKQLENLGFLLSKTKENANKEYKEKRIPFELLQTDVDYRLFLLAGIIDSDGMYVKSGTNFKYRIEMARKELMEDIFDLVASLGFFPSWYETYHTKDGVTRKYYRVDFFGSSEIPCLLPRKQFKRSPYDNALPCRIVEKGTGEYIGITVEADDHLFLLANGAVVHNCQDISVLQWKVIEKAFCNAEKVVIVGDDKQSIFTYNGARPDILISLAKKFPVKRLSMSYRLPKKAYLLANAVTSFIGNKTPQESVFKKDNPEGSIVQLTDIERITHYIDVDSLYDNVDENAWFLLARNTCFLDSIKSALEDALIPYWTADGFFMGGEIMQRIKTYEGIKNGSITNEEKIIAFQRKFEIADFNVPFTSTNLFTEGRKWVYASYIERFGLEALQDMCKWNPQILVSTIHHVKGAEARNVALLLDTTRRTRGNVFYDVDEELRVLYVGVTRTKENLYLIDSKNGDGFDSIINTIKKENHLEW